MTVLARLGLAIALFAALEGPATAQELGQPDDEAIAAPAQAVAVEPVARDGEIERRIQEILDATGWYRTVRVEVSDGIVFLDGVTVSPDHKGWARDLAARTQDVVAVVNRIAVEPEVRWTVEPAWREVQALLRAFVATLPLILLALVVLPLAWYAAKAVASLAEFLLRGRIGSPFLRRVMARTVAVPVFLLGLYVVLQVAGLTQLALSVVGGAGVLGIVFGFAFRDIAENFLASLLLSIRRPFRSGDLIDVDGREGIVQSMNTRSTVLLSVEGNHIQVPNASVFKSTIVNYSAAPARRDTLEAGIGYDASVAAAQRVIDTVLRRHPAVMDEPAPLVLVDSLGSATVNMRVYYWVDGNAYSMVKVKSALLRLIKKALTESGISMPDEAREIIFPQGVPILQLGGAAEQQAAAMATRDIAETARAESLEPEPEGSATASEGDLGNERAELEEQAAEAVIPESGPDLLADKP